VRIICNLADFENKKNKRELTFSEAGLPTYSTGKKNSIISVATRGEEKVHFAVSLAF
jgi:hypothetical protein